MDKIDSFCFLQNNSKKSITIRFSNSSDLDTMTFLNQYSNFELKSNSSKELLKYGDLFYKEAYLNQSEKKLYAFYLDYDSTQKYFLNRSLLADNYKKCIIKIEPIDIQNINKSDTIFFKP
jgi:hypothetical protein